MPWIHLLVEIGDAQNLVTDQALNNVPTFLKRPQELHPTLTLTPPNHLYNISHFISKGRPHGSVGPTAVGPKQVYTAQPFAMPRVGGSARKREKAWALAFEKLGNLQKTWSWLFKTQLLTTKTLIERFVAGEEESNIWKALISSQNWLPWLAIPPFFQSFPTKLMT